MKWNKLKDVRPCLCIKNVLVCRDGRFFCGYFSERHVCGEDYWFIMSLDNYSEFSHSIPCLNDDYWCELELPKTQQSDDLDSPLDLGTT